ncbi:MAG: transporter substrate-binding domain-containing protein [Endozoicomonas sp.]
MAKNGCIIRTALTIYTALVAGTFYPALSFASDQPCSRVVLSGHPNLPPVVWGDSQIITGAAPELVRNILQKHQIEVVSDYLGGNRRVLRKMQSGVVDINPAMVRTPEDEQYVQFIEPAIYTQSYSVIIKRGAENIPKNWEDLVKLQGVTPKGLSFGHDFDLFARDNLKLIRTFNAKQGLMMLNVGRVDYAIYPNIQGDLFVSLLDFEGRFEKAPVEIASFKLHIGISDKIGCKLPVKKIAEELKYLHKSGRADHTVNDNLYKWMEFSLDKRSNSFPDKI